MVLDPAHESLTRDKPTCHYCGTKLNLGYHYTCHVCDATYCFIHMGKHVRAHRAPGVHPDAPERELVPGMRAQILTPDPEEAGRIHSYTMGLLGPGEGPDPPSP